jgi:hypothetical protein
LPPDLGRDAVERSLVLVEAMIWMKSLRNATARVVVAFERDGKPYSRQSLTLQDVARRAEAWFPVRLTAFVPPDVQEGDRVSVYLANRWDPVYVDDLEMRWTTAVWP